MEIPFVQEEMKCLDAFNNGGSYSLDAFEIMGVLEACARFSADYQEQEFATANESLEEAAIFATSLSGQRLVAHFADAVVSMGVGLFGVWCSAKNAPSFSQLQSGTLVERRSKTTAMRSQRTLRYAR